MGSKKPISINLLNIQGITWTPHAVEAIAATQETGRTFLKLLRDIGYSLFVGNKIPFTDEDIGDNTLYVALVGRARCKKCKQLVKRDGICMPGHRCEHCDELTVVDGVTENYTTFIFFDGEEYRTSEDLPVPQCFMLRVGQADEAA